MNECIYHPVHVISSPVVARQGPICVNVLLVSDIIRKRRTCRVWIWIEIVVKVNAVNFIPVYTPLRVKRYDAKNAAH